MTSWGRALADDLQHTTVKFKTRVAPLSQKSIPTQKQNSDHKGNCLMRRVQAWDGLTGSFAPRQTVKQ